MRTISTLMARRVFFMPIPTFTSCSAPGSKDEPGCIYVLNNLGDKWSGTSVKTKWANQKFKPVAWDGHDTAHPDERTTDKDGNAEFPAPPRGYAVYAPV